MNANRPSDRAFDVKEFCRRRGGYTISACARLPQSNGQLTIQHPRLNLNRSVAAAAAAAAVLQ